MKNLSKTIQKPKDQNSEHPLISSQALRIYKMCLNIERRNKAMKKFNLNLEEGDNKIILKIKYQKQWQQKQT